MKKRKYILKVTIYTCKMIYTQNKWEEWCYVEFVLEHSPSISVRLRLFPSVLRPSITFFPTILSFSVPFSPIRVHVMFPSSPSHPFQAFHIRIRPVFSEFRPRFILLPLLFGYNPYQPNPIAPRSLLSSVPYCFMIRSFLLFRCV